MSPGLAIAVLISRSKLPGEISSLICRVLGLLLQCYYTVSSNGCVSGHIAGIIASGSL